MIPRSYPPNLNPQKPLGLEPFKPETKLEIWLFPYFYEDRNKEEKFKMTWWELISSGKITPEEVTNLQRDSREKIHPEVFRPTEQVLVMVTNLSYLEKSKQNWEEANKNKKLSLTELGKKFKNLMGG